MSDGLVWSFVLSFIGIAGIILAGSKYKLGWLIGLAVQPLWVWFAVSTGQYGFIINAVIYAAVYARNWLLWYKDERRGSDTDSFVFEKSELPEVVQHDVLTGHLTSSRFTHYQVGSWSMETADPDPYNESDGNPEFARSAALSWIAWYRHIVNRKDSELSEEPEEPEEPEETENNDLA